ncbi:hypothetical protein GCM10022200_24990 [Microbacterium awajiense]|uniref:Uncharacterized protein n=1 Tax=Microbacterium awajiense TaxID=415214 RepID=A0ABP7ATV0_9MICO
MNVTRGRTQTFAVACALLALAGLWTPEHGWRGALVRLGGELVTLINHGDDPAAVAVAGTNAESGDAVDVIELAPQGVAFVRVPVRTSVSATL